MPLRTTVEFDAEFSGEPLEPDGGMVAPEGGGLLMRVLAAGLRTKGFSVGAVEGHKFYGWAFTASKTGTSVWCMLQMGERWLLITEREVGLLKRVFGKRDRADDPVQTELCRAIHEVLVADERFDAPRWFAAGEWDANGPSFSEPT
jgi:hypothetical protein